MSTETEIIDAIEATTLFAKVRWLVAEADADTIPTILPLFILEDGGADLSQFATFCGTDPDLIVHEYRGTIIAKTAAEVRDLTVKVSIALKGIAALDGVTESYDSDLRAFIGELTIV
jgi:hypothetical protein